MLGSTCTHDLSRQQRSTASRASWSQAKLTPSHEHIRSWVQDQPGPVAVTYEAGPTGFGLSRSLTAAGIRCEVAAPPKLQKLSGDRGKTDAKDVVHLARLLRLDEITAVALPSADQEAARDLVRAREDCRGDLMRARHRLSKLLLRHGIVYYGGQAWTGKHDAWLRQEAQPQLMNRATRLTFDSDYDSVLTVKARRDRLDDAIEEMAADSEFTPLVRRLGCLRGVSTLTGFALRSRSATGTGSPATPSARSAASFRPSTPQARRGCRDRSPRPATPTCVGFWSRPPGTTAPATSWARPCATSWTVQREVLRDMSGHPIRGSHLERTMTLAGIPVPPLAAPARSAPVAGIEFDRRIERNHARAPRRIERNHARAPRRSEIDAAPVAAELVRQLQSIHPPQPQEPPVPAFDRDDVAPPPVPFSAGYRAGDFIFVSGQLPPRPDGSFLIGDFVDEVDLALDNLGAVLRAGGADFTKVVKVNAWLSNALLFAEFNDRYRRRFSIAAPARTTVVVGFAHPDIRVEIDAIAYLGD